jgi:hypothetical protein
MLLFVKLHLFELPSGNLVPGGAGYQRHGMIKMIATEYLTSLETDRGILLSGLRDLIIKHDRNVAESVERMMGKKGLSIKRRMASSSTRFNFGDRSPKWGGTYGQTKARQYGF